MIKYSKNPENTEEKMVERLEKLREENKKLNTMVNKLKSEQQFIGLSFIADDLEAEQFIDDKCFEDILDDLVDKDKEKNKDKDLKIKTYTNRRFRCYSHKREEENIIKDENDNNSNDSYSDYLWKPQRNRKDFIDFGTLPANDSADQQKKIEELEKNNKELEKKETKKEKDINRLNVNKEKIIKY